MIPFFENRTDRFSASYANQFNFPLHHHTHLDLCYVLEGSVDVTVSRQSSLLSDGSLAVIFPNQMHSYHTIDSSRVLCVISDLSMLGTHQAALTKYQPESAFLTAGELHPNVTYALNELAKELQTDKNSDIYSPLLQLTLARILPQLKLLPATVPNSVDITYQISQLVSTHFNQGLTLDFTARRIGISKHHLSHIFSEKMGLGFNDYVNSIRLSYAIEQIANTTRSMTDIGMEAGFESQRTFYRVFKEKLGITPLKYRRQVQFDRGSGDYTKEHGAILDDQTFDDFERDLALLRKK